MILRGKALDEEVMDFTGVISDRSHEVNRTGLTLLITLCRFSRPG